VGKILLARSLACSLGGSFKRIQFTPDLLTTDITGSSVLQRAGGSFEFVPGPIFANVVLADIDDLAREIDALRPAEVTASQALDEQRREL
jgi:MoxR-like ATPase